MRRVAWSLALAFTLAAALGSPAVAEGERTLSVYRLPTGAYQLLVRPAHAAMGGERGFGGERRVHLLTVPLVPGVELRSGAFPDFASVGSSVMEAYAEASWRDASDPSSCATAAASNDAPADLVTTDGATGAPTIFVVLPMSGPAFMPIGIGGTNFAQGTIPYVNGTPSIALFNWSCQNLPLIGSIAIGFTIVPPAAPRGPGDIVVEYLGQRSAPFPFSVR